ncbi:MAG: S-adenosylmethionine:tRNA ribosyltransferase-isomerase [Deltaproteobacteria bacterium]|nr:S-adenosylmethionine:tRNA ribosyltransferase-isomerase [Deltaproteobacteria bacterium]
MKTIDFDYFLPDDRIAAFPATQRDGSRLLRMDRTGGAPIHTKFAMLGAELPPASLIVLNDTRVIPARLRGRKSTGGAIELLLTRRMESSGDAVEMDWEALGRNLGWAGVGAELAFDGGLVAQIRRRGEAGAVEVRLRAPAGQTVMQMIERVGELPLPPYIEAARRESARQRGGADVALASDKIDADNIGADEVCGRDAAALDRDRYQTVFATAAGTVAAPTAGLHFTEDLLMRLQAEGHRIVRLTLHVGLGTFRPVKADTLDEHEMQSEVYTIPTATAVAVNDARRNGRPIVAVGTTVVRALESSAQALLARDQTGQGGQGGQGGQRDQSDVVLPGTAASRLFLRPGSQFHVVTDLITNFHLPRSTLLMLVSAFAGRENILAAYAEAIASQYRFYSYGDAMLIRGTP